jgi:hypothetical protein
MWPSLLEKRMAWSFGGYDDLRAISTTSALEALTGQPVTHRTEAIPATGTFDLPSTTEMLITNLRAYLRAGCVVLMTTKRAQDMHPPMTATMSVLEDMLAPRYLGLTPNHVYAVSSVDAGSRRVTMRDPHGLGHQLSGPLTASEW